MSAPPCYMECVLRIETSDGWEKSMTSVLKSFEDLRYEINPSLGFTYVKGKVDPQKILSQLKKGGKHATVEWISYGFPRDDQNQFQGQASGYNNNYLIPQDPYYHHARYPYNVYQVNHPYPNWYNMPQNALPYGNHHTFQQQHNGRNMYESGSFSNRSYDSRCPAHSSYHQSDLGNFSPPSETHNQTNDQPTQPTSFLKKLVGKFCFKC